MEKIHRTLVIAPVVSMPSFATSVQVRRVFPRHRRRPRAAIGPRDVPQLTYCAFTWMQTQTLLSGVPANAGIDQNNSAVPEASDIPLGPAGQIEIPFVPAHKRQTLANPQNFELKDDTVVVVGQAGTRQRKRKRDKVRGVASVSQPKSGTSASTGDRDQEEEEFDYSSVPNLLDNESKRGDARGVHVEDERRKKKQRHGKGMSMSSPDRHAKKKQCQRHVFCLLRGIRFVFTLARDNIYYPSICSWCHGRQWIGKSLVLLLIPGLRATEIYSRIWTLRIRQLSGATARPTRS